MVLHVVCIDQRRPVDFLNGKFNVWRRFMKIAVPSLNGFFYRNGFKKSIYSSSVLRQKNRKRKNVSIKVISRSCSELFRHVLSSLKIKYKGCCLGNHLNSPNTKICIGHCNARHSLLKPNFLELSAKFWRLPSKFIRIYRTLTELPCNWSYIQLRGIKLDSFNGFQYFNTRRLNGSIKWLLNGSIRMRYIDHLWFTY